MALETRNANKPQVSIIIPTYNESQNILNVLKSIGDIIPKNIFTEAIVVDDNSPDGTGKIVEDYLKNVKKIAGYTVNVIHRTAKNGLSSAILSGIQRATGDTIVVMDSDLSHPPQIIPKMIETLRHYQCDMVVASRYITGGKINGWNKKRKLLSKIATMIAKKGLGVKTNDPMSGFFAFRKGILKGLNFDAIGYKILLEILVKKRGLDIKEIPYTFQNRTLGSSKLDFPIIIDYVKSVWKLYRSGKPEENNEKRKSVKFFSKAGRFYTIGATGFAINYIISLMFSGGLTEIWYLHANILGIITSMTSNFVLNKWWTFGDRDFSFKKTISQFSKFIMFSSFGALIQLGVVFSLVDNYDWMYTTALGVGVLTGAFSNFILNKKWTFKDKLW
ncbi:MAG: glycosyltransferase family 2 protein [Nitrosopumilus sp.]|uniref:Dolichol-phosphate mannosyltransferase n=1 Tax=Nitrosopumilus zosterae TaxID=718286 RepID=A0A2S2KTU3_9ARCH|nr:MULTISPECIES: glycosyltransferase family 2 protein [Nitrosopumilus]MCV0365636.1 glycosyltransferase family 2 protein [Nitrosopumilus sp.]BDQ31906.1 glycosyltransferase family 2 protein [Nitrosopumilus zosterae]GBH35049.1 dolichol monophosphate mannose synthase [Nitrosopumilus zosterae]